ncbi:MAG: metallophosphoesterase [Gemmatimonadales bacterium]|nr:metallophosphoesterase [Gemmatimonadales bacterium]
MTQEVSIVHISDVHFGVDADLAQLEHIEEYLPTMRVDAIALSGDLSQRARHGEFMAAHSFIRRLRKVAPVLVVPGNHDVQWWASPFGIRGTEPLYRKYRRYFGDNLTPVLEVPGAVIAGALTSYGVSAGSLTWRLRDIAVKGHLPVSETDRVRAVFAAAPPTAARVLVIHHNVLPGQISQRHGLAGWGDAQRRLQETGADVLLCGHDHQESAGQVGGRLAVSAAGTHTSRTRGRRPSVFNLVRVDSSSVHVQHFRWESASRKFLRSDQYTFARSDSRHVVVSVTGGDQPS